MSTTLTLAASPCRTLTLARPQHTPAVPHDPAVAHLLERLQADFPLAFRPGRVLAIGVYRDLRQLGYGPAKVLHDTLRYWTIRSHYLKAMARGAYRTALDGSVAARNHPGGTAPEQVRAAIAAARAALVK